MQPIKCSWESKLPLRLFIYRNHSLIIFSILSSMNLNRYTPNHAQLPYTKNLIIENLIETQNHSNQKNRIESNIPQILIGASSSRRLDCWRKISLEATQSCLISFSESWTCFPGLADRTSRRRLIISSRTTSSIPGDAIQRLWFKSQRERDKRGWRSRQQLSSTMRSCLYHLFWVS